jgi:hypothetical protein
VRCGAVCCAMLCCGHMSCVALSRAVVLCAIPIMVYFSLRDAVDQAERVSSFIQQSKRAAAPATVAVPLQRALSLGSSRGVASAAAPAATTTTTTSASESSAKLIAAGPTATATTAAATTTATAAPGAPPIVVVAVTEASGGEKSTSPSKNPNDATAVVSPVRLLLLSPVPWCVGCRLDPLFPLHVSCDSRSRTSATTSVCLHRCAVRRARPV